MALAIEVWMDDAQGIVTSGGTDAPAAGTSESISVTVLNTFPTASTSSTPNTFFYVADPAAPSEVMKVTNGAGSGGSWTFIRGANGVTVTHLANYQLVQVVDASTLGGFASVDANNRLGPQNRDNVSSSVFTTAQSAASLVNGTNHRFNCNANSVSQPLPAQPPNGTTFGFSRTDTSTSFTLTITPGSGDTIPTPNPTVVAGAQTIFYTYNAGLATWNVNSSNLPLSNLLTTSVANTLYASLGVPAYQGSANYVAGQEVVGPNGAVYYALNAITGSPVTFNPAQWSLVSAPSAPGPEDFGWVSWTMDPMLAIGATATPVAGTVYLCACPVRKVSTFTNIAMAAKNSPVLTGAAYYGVYSIGATTATLLSATADFHTSWTAPGALPEPLATQQTNQQPGWYYAALLVVSGTTLPTVESATGSATFAQLANAGLTGSTTPPLRFAIAATGASVLPATITLSSLTGTSAIPFGALIY